MKKPIKDLGELVTPVVPPELIFTCEGGPFNLDWRFTFGKYRHQRLEDIIDRDNEYVAWCLDNVAGFFLTKTAKRELELTQIMEDDPLADPHSLDA